MNDTHGVAGEGWYGFDLDGTLAVYDTWKGIDHIGEPIKPMVDLIKRMHDEGKIVKILTARVAPRKNEECVKRLRCDAPDYVKNGDYSCLAPDAKALVENMYIGYDTWGAYEFIVDWCLKNLGFFPEITHEKNHLMIELYDDRVKQVVPNTGELVEDIVRIQSGEIQKCERIFNSYERNNLRLSRKLDCKINGFFSGLMLGSLLTGLLIVLINAIGRSNSLTEAEKNLDKAIHAYIEAKTEVKL